MKAKEKAREESRAKLLELLKPGDTVYTVLRHVSRSGMFRRIDIHLPGREDYGMRWLSVQAARALGWREPPPDKDGIPTSGCGMDMGFHLVYELSSALFPDGFNCVGIGCPSNDHSNGDRLYDHHHHKDGGYALRHRWL